MLECDFVLQTSAEEELESKLGFDLFSEGEKRLG
ncbi:hypothetical protein TIFTF001_030240 [Ficus carica]|uniref:Uncharacterized protein n=1 Tax=Ficus carica TaxID=3494 RepID=A0AA88DT83_FICCA|nr:hypothetical protein TIFTF001_030240 [Ficus carica]